MSISTFTADRKGESLSPRFRVGDFWACERQNTILLDTELASIWEKFTSAFGKAPTLRRENGKTVETACFRDSVNWSGSRLSQHCLGRAADMAIEGVCAWELARFAETLPEIGGIGLYLAPSGELEKIKHIHVDTREKRALWGWNHLTSNTNTPGHGGIACTFYYEPKRLQHSAAVEAIQRALSKKGFDCGAPDGVYGGATAAAVAAFQKEAGLSPDGVFGADTNRALALFSW